MLSLTVNIRVSLFILLMFVPWQLSAFVIFCNISILFLLLMRNDDDDDDDDGAVVLLVQ